MYAVVKTGGKQYTVKPGDVIAIEKLPAGVGETVELPVIFVADGDKIEVDPTKAASTKVTAEILDQFKDKKQLVFKFKRRKGYKKLRGHRQQLTRVRIMSVGSEEFEKPIKKIDEVEDKAGVEVDTEAEATAKTKAEGSADTKAKDATKPATKAKVPAEAEVDSKAEAEVDSKADDVIEAKGDVTDDAESEAKADANAEADVTVDTDANADADIEAKVEADIEGSVDTDAETASEE